MSRDNVNQWDTISDNNSDIAGINIAEGCPAGSINNALRTIMSQVATWIISATGPILKVGGFIPTATQVADSAGIGRLLGFRSLPISRSVTAATNLTLADQDCCIVSTAGALNIQLNATTALPVGFLSAFYVDAAASRTITADSGVTLRLEGASSAGTRTIAQRSRGYVWQVKTNEWIVSGMGVT